MMAKKSRGPAARIPVHTVCCVCGGAFSTTASVSAYSSASRLLRCVLLVLVGFMQETAHVHSSRKEQVRKHRHRPRHTKIPSEARFPTGAASKKIYPAKTDSLPRGNHKRKPIPTSQSGLPDSTAVRHVCDSRNSTQTRHSAMRKRPLQTAGSKHVFCDES